ncbi:methyltransferase [Streptomyces sp. NPDC060235]|uniref:methyltransferase n=1 Tax=Streptomyces sp. NPDC060235 TaxID=3347080 RepID=UPI003665D9E1
MVQKSEEVSGKLAEVESWRVQEATEISFLGLDWILLPDVYPVQRSSASLFAWEVLQELEPMDNFLEIGIGPGNNVVMAAKSGLCRRATGTDINPNAVESARLNAERHGVADSLNLLVSDVFDSVDEEKFDLVFWNSPPVLEVNETVDLSNHERSFFDPGYEAHIRYFTQARRYLAESGRLMIGFCSRGNYELLTRTAAEAGFASEVIAKRPAGHEHWLVEFTELVSPA